MIGSDAFQEADTVGITRPCTKHNWLVKETDKLADSARGFPCRDPVAPVRFWSTFPRTCSLPTALHSRKSLTSHYQPSVKGDMEADHRTGQAMEKAKRPCSIPAAA